MWQNRSSLLGKFHIKILDFPNSDLQVTHFHAFYLLRHYYYDDLF